MPDSEVSVQHLSKLIISVFRLNGRIIEWGDLLGAPLGLTSARWQIMGAIELAGEALTAPQISRAMGITRQGVQKQLNHLMQQGLVGQRNNPVHERSYLYELTDKGREIYRQIIVRYTGRFEDVASGISPQALSDMHNILHVMTMNIERQITHKNGKAMLRSLKKEEQL